MQTDFTQINHALTTAERKLSASKQAEREIWQQLAANEEELASAQGAAAKARAQVTAAEQMSLTSSEAAERVQAAEDKLSKVCAPQLLRLDCICLLLSTSQL